MIINSSISYRLNKYGLKLFTTLPNTECFKKAIIISANPRGGSTWLEEILGQLKKSICYYEPLNVSYIPELKSMGFSMRNHIPQFKKDLEAEKYFKKLLVGKLYNTRMTFHPMAKKQNILDVIRAKRRVYKFCRLNLMLPWLVDTFDQIAQPILFLRHPCAVIASQIKYGEINGGGWSSVDSQLDFLKQKNDKYFSPYFEYCSSLNKKEEILAAVWCLTNKYPLEHEYNNNKWITISYEDLLINKEEVLKKLSYRLGLTSELTNLLEFADRQYASKTSLNNKKIDVNKQLESWKQSLSEIEITNIMKVVKHFEMDKFYNLNLHPNYKELYNQK